MQETHVYLELTDTREPDAGKLARPVRRRGVEKGPAEDRPVALASAHHRESGDDNACGFGQGDDLHTSPARSDCLCWRIARAIDGSHLDLRTCHVLDSRSRRAHVLIRRCHHHRQQVAQRLTCRMNGAATASLGSISARSLSAFRTRWSTMGADGCALYS